MPEWLTTSAAAKLLGKGERTLQEWAKTGKIKTKSAGIPTNPLQRLYEGKDVARLIAEAQPKGKWRPKPTERALTHVKPTQNERALDTVSLVGNLVLNHKAEMEMLMRQFESIVSLVLTSQKAEADANRERLKAEREDARERWELERQDRLDRRKSRAIAVPQPIKVRKAHA